MTLDYVKLLIARISDFILLNGYILIICLVTVGFVFLLKNKKEAILKKNYILRIV